MEQKPIRVGIIGCGGIFHSLHRPFYEKTQEAVIVACADVNPQRAEETARRFSALAFTDFRELLEKAEVDAVDVCTHPATHRDIAVASARAGKHILMEKPLCRTVAEADEMIAEAQKAGVRLQVAYMLRYDPLHQRLKELLDTGVLGEPHLIWSNEIGWFPPHHPWLFKREESGGMLVEQAIHTIDEWLWLYGPVKWVFSKVSTIPLGGTYPPIEEAVENNAVMMVGFERGGTGVLLKSWSAEIGQGGKGVVGSKGTATLTGKGLIWKTHDMPAPETFKPDPPSELPEPERRNYFGCLSKGQSIQHWLNCIRGLEEPETDGVVGRAGMEVAEAAYIASQENRVVFLPLGRD